MADLTRDAPLRFRYPNLLKKERWVLDNSTAQTIYKGQPIMLDMDVDTVYGRGFTSSVTIASGDVFLGIAAEGATVATSDTETDNEIEIITGGEVGFRNSFGFTDADVGKAVYFSDSGTLTTTSTGNLSVGRITRVENGYVFVQINPGGYPTVQ